jgi:osmotically-inducible protein OsmY
MNNSDKRWSFADRSVLGSVLCAVGCAAAPAGVSTAAEATECPHGAVASPAMQGADPSMADTITKRVQAALHSDQYFYDGHVMVSMESGSVVLRGFVFSEWDLRDAIQIARAAACHWRVVDDLTIEVGGRQ